jgi:cell wall-associated NlpC family hydrolase
LGKKAIKYVHGEPNRGQDPHKGFDCSGFVTYVLKNSGVIIPDYIDINNTRRVVRHANEYWDNFGIAVHHGLHQSGDLIFFTRNGYFPSHVGIVLDESSYIHSPGKDNTIVEICSITETYKEFDVPSLLPIVFNRNPIGYKSPVIPLDSRDYRYLQKPL